MLLKAVLTHTYTWEHSVNWIQAKIELRAFKWVKISPSGGSEWDIHRCSDQFCKFLTKYVTVPVIVSIKIPKPILINISIIRTYNISKILSGNIFLCLSPPVQEETILMRGKVWPSQWCEHMLDCVENYFDNCNSYIKNYLEKYQ